MGFELVTPGLMRHDLALYVGGFPIVSIVQGASQKLEYISTDSCSRDNIVTINRAWNQVLVLDQLSDWK